jgi:hypothetical protein
MCQISFNRISTAYGPSFIIIFLLFLSCEYRQTRENSIQTDICILGGSEAGFTAAIQAARLGKNVLLIEPTGHPGGMMVEGIVKDIRFGSSVVIGGIAREVYTAIEAHYDRIPEFDKYGWYSNYEPHVADSVIESFLAAEKQIQIIRKSRIREKEGVHKKGTIIAAIELENGQHIRADIFIDASIEGHLLHLSGVSTETIREGNARYGETKNGIQTNNTYRQFEVGVDPYIEKGNPNSGLIPTVQTGEPGNFGEPDKHIQGFCFRMVLTRDSANVIPIEKPANYNPFNYEIYRRYLKAGGQLFKPQGSRPGGKTDLGSWHDLSANLYGENWAYPAGSYDVQDSIVQYHKDFTQGLIWFLQHDEAVDAQTKENWEGWGFCKDEYIDNAGWPRRLYIRSARRMVSDFVITESDTKRENAELVNDPVAIAWWPPDTHHARRIVKDGFAYNEGFVFGGDDWKPFGISWKALIPKASECANLITPTCLSSSYVAYGAMRIVPTFMILGQTAGCAAAIASDNVLNVQEVEYEVLKRELIRQNQILQIPENWLEYVQQENK